MESQTNTPNFFNIEEKYEKEIKFRDNKIALARKWKVKDRKNLKKLIEENGDNITPIQLASVLIFPCLKDKNILLTEEEIKYALSEIRSHSISDEFKFSYVCSNDECNHLNNQTLKVSEVNKPKWKEWSTVLINDLEIEFGEIVTPKFYYEKMYEIKDPYDRFLADMAFHIVRVNEAEGIIKFEQFLESFEEMDTEVLDKIIEEFKKQRFTQDNEHECTCEKCKNKDTFIFDEIPDFFPKSWFE